MNELKAAEVAIEEIPNISELDTAFGCVNRTYRDLMAKIWPLDGEAECVGDKNGYEWRAMLKWENSKWGDMVNQIFFSGASKEEKEKWILTGLSDEQQLKVWKYFRAVISSFDPKHEEKVGLCAWLLSRVLESPVKIIGNKE